MIMTTLAEVQRQDVTPVVLFCATPARRRADASGARGTSTNAVVLGVLVRAARLEPETETSAFAPCVLDPRRGRHNISGATRRMK